MSLPSQLHQSTSTPSGEPPPPLTAAVVPVPLSGVTPQISYDEVPPDQSPDDSAHESQTPQSVREYSKAILCSRLGPLSRHPFSHLTHRRRAERLERDYIGREYQRLRALRETAAIAITKSLHEGSRPGLTCMNDTIEDRTLVRGSASISLSHCTLEHGLMMATSTSEIKLERCQARRGLRLASFCRSMHLDRCELEGDLQVTETLGTGNVIRLNSCTIQGALEIMTRAKVELEGCVLHGSITIIAKDASVSVRGGSIQGQLRISTRSGDVTLESIDLAEASTSVRSWICTQLGHLSASFAGSPGRVLALCAKVGNVVCPRHPDLRIFSKQQQLAQYLEQQH